MLTFELNTELSDRILQNLLDELGELTKPNADGSYNVISAKQINALRAKYFEASKPEAP